ncbi:MAG: adenosylhomocysteinase [Thermoproteota archaeon]
MPDFKIKDLNLADKGEMLIEWASRHMPVLNQISERFKNERSLKGLRIGACLHVTKETAVLIKTLMDGGAEVALCGSNPLSTQDEVAAALVKMGAKVYAWRGETTEEYYWCINKVIDFRPMITLDDGADLVTTMHLSRKDALKDVLGGTEETTTGVMRLKAMAEKYVLRYPIIAVNNAYTKYLFDNRYGTGQSTIDGIMRATNILLAGKTVVVCGYGWCGRGIAMRARGMGANVIVTEVNPIRALEAVMDGFQVMPLSKAAEIGDLFITATGNISVIRKEHILKMKDGAILANSGHFNVEISLPDLESISISKRTIRPNLDEYILKSGKRVCLLAEGRLVNLAAAEGHPSEVMDMSFSNQTLCVEYLAKKPKLEPKVYDVPREIDETVARLKLRAINIQIDEMTEEQRKYIESWESGTT